MRAGRDCAETIAARPSQTRPVRRPNRNRPQIDYAESKSTRLVSRRPVRPRDSDSVRTKLAPVRGVWAGGFGKVARNSDSAGENPLRGVRGIHSARPRSGSPPVPAFRATREFRPDGGNHSVPAAPNRAKPALNDAIDATFQSVCIVDLSCSTRDGSAVFKTTWRNRKRVPPARIERATPCLGNKCSIH